jgi:hypothetical protein
MLNIAASRDCAEINPGALFCLPRRAQRNSGLLFGEVKRRIEPAECNYKKKQFLISIASCLLLLFLIKRSKNQGLRKKKLKIVPRV